MTAVVQVNGKVRDRLEVSPKIDRGDELEQLARASAAVQRAIGDREIVNVIVRAPKSREHRHQGVATVAGIVASQQGRSRYPSTGVTSGARPIGRAP